MDIRTSGFVRKYYERNKIKNSSYAKKELKTVYDNKSTIDSVISLLSSTYADSYITENNFRFYWSATNASDDANGEAWCVDFSNGSASKILIATGRSSVAIREF